MWKPQNVGVGLSLWLSCGIGSISKIDRKGRVNRVRAVNVDEDCGMGKGGKNPRDECRRQTAGSPLAEWRTRPCTFTLLVVLIAPFLGLIVARSERSRFFRSQDDAVAVLTVFIAQARKQAKISDIS
jgi:hypothetical protein